MDGDPIQLVTVTPVENDTFPPGVRRIDYRSGVDGLADWALVRPPRRGGTWVVNLHGHGSTGDQLYTREDIKRDWLTAFTQRGLGLLTPHLRGDAWMAPDAAKDLHGLLQLIREQSGLATTGHSTSGCHRAACGPLPDSRSDAGSNGIRDHHGHGAASRPVAPHHEGNGTAPSPPKFVFISGSMGGTGALIYAALHPEDVAAVAAMCPATDIASLHAYCAGTDDVRFLAEAICSAYGGTPDEVPDVYDRHSALRHRDRLAMPIYIAHGSDDASIPVAESRALAAAGIPGRLKYREIPGGHHDSPLAADILAEALAWVLDSNEGR